MTYNVFAGTLVVKPYSTQPQELQHRPNYSVFWPHGIQGC